VLEDDVLHDILKYYITCLFPGMVSLVLKIKEAVIKETRR